jgi:hypothetical protein
VKKHASGVRGVHSCVLEESNSRCWNLGVIFDGDYSKSKLWW